MKLWLIAAVLLCLCQTGQSQGSAYRWSVATGTLVSGSSGLGYDNPTLGAWSRIQVCSVRVVGEVDNSRKAWVDDGLSWRVTGMVDSPSWRKLSAMAVAGVVQHRNSQWVKSGGWGGAGGWYRAGYSYYGWPDSSLNRTSRWVIGAESTGPVYVAMEFQRLWFDQGAVRLAGWAVATRVGWMRGRLK